MALPLSTNRSGVPRQHAERHNVPPVRVAQIWVGAHELRSVGAIDAGPRQLHLRGQNRVLGWAERLADDAALDGIAL